MNKQTGYVVGMRVFVSSLRETTDETKVRRAYDTTSRWRVKKIQRQGASVACLKKTKHGHSRSVMETELKGS